MRGPGSNTGQATCRSQPFFQAATWLETLRTIRPEVGRVVVASQDYFDHPVQAYFDRHGYAAASSVGASGRVVTGQVAPKPLPCIFMPFIRAK